MQVSVRGSRPQICLKWLLSFSLSLTHSERPLSINQPADTGWEAGYAMDTSTVNRQSLRLTFTPLESPMNLCIKKTVNSTWKWQRRSEVKINTQKHVLFRTLYRIQKHSQAYWQYFHEDPAFGTLHIAMSWSFCKPILQKNPCWFKRDSRVYKRSSTFVSNHDDYSVLFRIQHHKTA